MAKWKILELNLNNIPKVDIYVLFIFLLLRYWLKILLYMGTNKTKPYKIQEENNVGRVGVTAENLKDLRRQAIKRLNISQDFQPYLDDGTAVLTEEYFQRLEPQTCFTFRAPYEENIKMGRFASKFFNRSCI